MTCLCECRPPDIDGDGGGEFSEAYLAGSLSLERADGIGGNVTSPCKLIEEVSLDSCQLGAG